MSGILFRSSFFHMPIFLIKNIGEYFLQSFRFVFYRGLQPANDRC